MHPDPVSEFLVKQHPWLEGVGLEPEDGGVGGSLLDPANAYQLTVQSDFDDGANEPVPVLPRGEHSRPGHSPERPVVGTGS